MSLSEKKCECDETGKLMPGMDWMYNTEKELPFVNHKPGKCECKNELKRYIRAGKKVWLCSNCCMMGDKLICQ